MVASWYGVCTRRGKDVQKRGLEVSGEREGGRSARNGEGVERDKNTNSEQETTIT